MTVQVNMHGIDIKLVDCYVLDQRETPIDLIIGRDPMEQHGLRLDIESRSVSGRRKDGSSWTVYLPTELHESCVHFSAAVPCYSVQDQRIDPG